MSREHQREEGMRWLRQAEDDVAAAELLGLNAKYAQACFLSQQAAEKALKSIWILHGAEPWGHSIVRLIGDLEIKSVKSQFEGLLEQAMILDRLYIPTRYPIGLPGLVPLEAYGAHDVEMALSAAREFVHRARAYVVA